jgi:hypothetical protein
VRREEPHPSSPVGICLEQLWNSRTNQKPLEDSFVRIFSISRLNMVSLAGRTITKLREESGQ